MRRRRPVTAPATPRVASSATAAPPSSSCSQAAATGAYKASLPWWKIVLLGMVAGCYVGLGGALLLTGARRSRVVGLKQEGQRWACWRRWVVRCGSLLGMGFWEGACGGVYSEQRQSSTAL